MELKVIKKFNGKEEGKTLCPGDKIQCDDIDRINTLVGRGYCIIVSIDNAPMPVNVIADSYVEFRGSRHHVETVKVALGEIGVRVAHNAGVKAVSNAIANLSDEQSEALAVKLNTDVASDPNNE